MSTHVQVPGPDFEGGQQYPLPRDITIKSEKRHPTVTFLNGRQAGHR